MKQFLLTFMALGCFAISILAQPGHKPSRERIDELRVAYLTEKLDLTVEEGQVFWPLYNEFQSDRRTLEHGMRKEMKALFDKENPSDEDVLKMIEKMESHHVEMSAMHADFLKQALTILGARRTILLEKSDEDFKREVLKRIRDKR
ncbi:MAG: hypothetical protein P8O05_00900 [Flavobacteriales bacterium]|nr:hypothetical protein [Flavobacteriales bacterium]MDG2247003.1 hypothetical protein [Flavobacteriales bacterium]